MSIEKPRYYSYQTQRLCNAFPSWMALRNERTSIGQQVINTLGIQMQDATRTVAEMLNATALNTANTGLVDTLYKVSMPRVNMLDENDPPTITGDALNIEVLDELNDFYFFAPPTRIVYMGAASDSSLAFNSDLVHDIPFYDKYGNAKDLYCAIQDGNLLKYHLVDEGKEVPAERVTGREILGTYALQDQNGVAIVGEYGGSCLSRELLALLYRDSTTKVPASNMPTARQSLCTAAVNDVAYSIGGRQTDGEITTYIAAVEAYDPATNIWTTKTPMPTGRYKATAAVVNNIIYVVGGSDQTALYSTTVEAYDPSTDTWTTKAPIPVAMRNAASGGIGDRLYVVGGETGSGIIATLYIYTPETDTWTTGTPMPTARDEVSAGVVEDILYVAGGADEGGLQTIVEAYNPETDTWETKASMPDGLVGTNYLAVLDNVLYAGTYSFGSNDNALLAYDSETDTWESKNALFTPRYHNSLVGIGGMLYLIGGTNYSIAEEEDLLHMDLVETYLILQDQWIATPVTYGTGDTLYLYDMRIPLLPNTDPSFVGNAEQTYLTPVLQYAVVESLGETTGLAFDIDVRYFWIQSDTSYYQYKLCFDYAIVDYTKNNVFFREPYTATLIDGVGYSQEIYNLFNTFDNYGDLLDTPRLTGESNQDYKDRLLEVFAFRANSTVQGLVDGISREVSLSSYGYHTQGDYPTNLFADGIFPTGYNIFESGVYPTDASGIAQINALYDPHFYWTLVDPATNIPSATFAEYTREILQTTPIVWGSGTGDPLGFIWDISPFDGGYNATQIVQGVPDFFALETSGISSDYIQSGVSNPNSTDLTVRLIQISGAEWIPQVRRGDLFIHDRLYHLLANPASEVIASGLDNYTIQSSGIPGLGLIVVDASGNEYLHVDSFSAESREFTVSGYTISFDEDHPELQVIYETSEDPWYTIPGWDFNPTHAAIEDGFIWVSDTQQVIDPATSYTLTVTPETLYYGVGGGSVAIGRLLDVDGEPVIGAQVYFNLQSSIGDLTTTSALTGLDGRAFAFYNSPDLPIFASGIETSGYSLIVDREVTAADVTNLDAIWTVKKQADIGGYPEQINVMWLEYKETVEVNIAHAEWASGSYFSGTYTGKFTLKAIDNTDDAYNIKLSSIVRVVGGSPAGIPALESDSGENIVYDPDHYSDPQDFGKISLYAAIIPEGTTVIRFDVYAPVKPTNVQPNVPAVGQSTLTYPYQPDPAVEYLVASPAIASIDSWAVFQGTTTNHQLKTIRLNFNSQQTGVFRVDNSYLDFCSFIRYTGT